MTVTVVHCSLHTTKMKISCAECSMTFKFQRTLKSHQERAHNLKTVGSVPTDESKVDEERKYPCPDCDKKFKNSGHLSDHKIVVHDHGYFNCLKCDFKARSRFRLRTHRVSNHPEHTKKEIKKSIKSRTKNYKKSLKRAIQVSNIKIK